MKAKRIVRDILILLGALAAATALSIQSQRLDVEEHITTIFVFAVFLISLFTGGYLYGVAGAVIGMVAINFAFTYPYFAFDFMNPVNLISAVIMVSVSIVTSLLVTKIKQHEAAKAEGEREKMRANLMRAVSHDLRTPLTTIYSASNMLRDSGAALTEEQQNTMLERIQKDAEWLVRMVENLLSVTRIDNDTMKITKVPTILDELVDSAVTKFSTRHPEQNVTLELPDEIVVIPMDALLIEQVLLNLLENAVYHAAGMTALELRVFTLGNQAVFEIADDGCGYDARQVFIGGTEIKLSQTEYNIVALLSEQCGKMMTYSAIIKGVWGYPDEGSTKKLQVNMANIRKKFGVKPGEAWYITNELGVGYRMNGEKEE